MNLVLVLTDDQTYESLPKMPYVNGRNDWTRFTSAFIHHPLCCPSRATLLKGKYSHRTGVDRNTKGHKFNDSKSLATWLQGAGYETGLVGKYMNDYPWHRGTDYVPPGWDQWFAFEDDEGPAYYDYEVIDNGRLIAYGSHTADYSTDVFGRRAKRFVEESSEPFFLQFSPWAPHGDPIRVAPRHKGAYADEPLPHSPNFNEEAINDKSWWWRNRPKVSASDADRSRRKRWEALLAVDEAVRGIFDALQEKGALDNTAVIFMTDNGFALGEHRWRGKLCQFEECIRTPLLIRYPQDQPRAIDARVSNIDIAPTLTDLAGLDPPTDYDGRSLVPLLQGATLPERPVLLHSRRHWSANVGPDAGYPPGFWGVRTERYKYVEVGRYGEPELYDLLEDPFELRDRATSEHYADIKAELAALLRQLKPQ